MGWEEELFALFDDLESQATALYDAERGPEIAGRSRAEYGQVTLASRLMASIDLDVTLELIGVGAVTGQVARVATGWCLLRGAGQDWVVRTDAIAAVHAVSERSVPEVAWPAVAQLGLGSALRRLAESREPCALHLLDGRHIDGVLRRVGQDFVEILSGEAERVVLVSFGQLAAVQSRR